MSEAPKSQVLKLADLVSYQEGSVVSRQITKADAGNVTLFAFDAGQELSEHTAPFDALAHIVEGEVEDSCFWKTLFVEGGRGYHHARQRTARRKSQNKIQDAADDDTCVIILSSLHQTNIKSSSR